MQLYRLDTPAGPVVTFAGDYLSQSLASARERGKREAAERQQPVTLSTITNSGQVRPSWLIQPSGKATRIPNPRR